MTPSLPDLNGPLSGLAALNINPNALEALMALHNGPQSKDGTVYSDPFNFLPLVFTEIVESEKSSVSLCA